MNNIYDILQSVDFASPQIINAAKKYTHLYQIDRPNILITLLLKTSINQYWTNRINNLIKLIRKLQKYYHTTAPINITIIPTTLKKQLPKVRHQIIGVNECNSGATISYHHTKSIIIWREEELEKVLIHEFIHYYGLDKTVKGSSRDYRESYTETLATVWYTKDLTQECQHSLENLARLIQYWYGKEYPVITKRRPIPKGIEGKVSEETSVIGYYWIKAAVLYQLVNGDMKLNMKKITGSEYMKLARKGIRDEGFQTALKGEYEKNRGGRSLRMTAAVAAKNKN